MNRITQLKLAGMAEALKTIGNGAVKTFQGSASVGGEIGKLLGSETIGRGVGYAAPLLAANWAANQTAPTRRAKVWLGEQVGAGGNALGRALVPGDFGNRPGDF